MPFVLQLNTALKQAGWKVKIHDYERLEPPHITVYQKMRKWRLSLRNGEFLDIGDKWSQIDDDVCTAILDKWDELITEWDRIHPENPVIGEMHD